MEFSVTGGTGTEVFAEMMHNRELVEDSMEVVAGHWPENYDECVLVVSQSGRISDFLSYVLGLRDRGELEQMVKQFSKGRMPAMMKGMGGLGGQMHGFGRKKRFR